MKKIFKYVKSDKIIRLSMSISLALLLVETIYVGLFFMQLPQYLPLFNQMPWGEERLGSRLEIFLPIVVTLLFLIFNFFLLNKLYERMPLMSRILSITTILITALSVIFTIQTLQIIL
jgi:hypothetical protein